MGSEYVCCTYCARSGAVLWFNFSWAILSVMGSLLLPMLIVFIAYSVNNIEHKAETWKTLFTLPISKFSIYSAKYLYALVPVGKYRLYN